MSDMYGRDEAIMGGRWVFRDPESGRLTRLPIGGVKASLVSPWGGRDWVKTQGWPYLTDDQLDFALNFDFPAQRAFVFDFVDGYIYAGCACGESLDLPEETEARSIPLVCDACGKAWTVTITVEETPQ